MDTNQLMTADERLAIMMRGIMWAYNFLAFALLIDIMYRAVIFDEGFWDLFVLIVASGVISMIYAARHK